MSLSRCVQLSQYISSSYFFFFNDTATTEIYTRSIVGSVRCVQETGTWGPPDEKIENSIRFHKKQQNYKGTSHTLSNEEKFLEKTEDPAGYSQEEDKLPIAFSKKKYHKKLDCFITCLLYTSPSPRDLSTSRMPSSA
eukprot:TRINITY_DN46733_c0_g1_i1.p2 TRINITY_DN46733_c0_g1~~TRINITY_DN46733_c0_g1_i1.p2  ORF type:complete len:137 (+),score=45.77 TRINITY_DN46733_c0_g1_i1:28-438(+)